MQSEQYFLYKMHMANEILLTFCFLKSPPLKQNKTKSQATQICHLSGHIIWNPGLPLLVLKKEIFCYIYHFISENNKSICH